MIDALCDQRGKSAETGPVKERTRLRVACCPCELRRLATTSWAGMTTLVVYSLTGLEPLRLPDPARGATARASGDDERRSLQPQRLAAVLGRVSEMGT